MEYINTRTGVVVTITSEVSGGDWQPVKKVADTPKKSEKSETPKETKRTK